jgi:hypothetical protein
MKRRSLELPIEYPRYAIAVNRDPTNKELYIRQQNILEALVGPNIYDASDYDDLESQYASIVSDLITQQQYECTTISTTVTPFTATKTTLTSHTQTSNTKTLFSTMTSNSTITIIYGASSSKSSATSSEYLILLLLVLLPCCCCAFCCIQQRTAGSEDLLACGDESTQSSLAIFISSLGDTTIPLTAATSADAAPNRQVVCTNPRVMTTFPQHLGRLELAAGNASAMLLLSFLESVAPPSTTREQSATLLGHEAIAGEEINVGDTLVARQAVAADDIAANSAGGVPVATSDRAFGRSESPGECLLSPHKAVVDTATRAENVAQTADFFDLKEVYASSEAVRGYLADFVEGEGIPSDGNPLLFATVHQNSGQSRGPTLISGETDATRLARRASASRSLDGCPRSELVTIVHTARMEQNQDGCCGSETLIAGDGDTVPAAINSSVFETAVENLFRTSRGFSSGKLPGSSYPPEQVRAQPKRSVADADSTLEALCRIKPIAAAKHITSQHLAAVSKCDERQSDSVQTIEGPNISAKLAHTSADQQLGESPSGLQLKKTTNADPKSRVATADQELISSPGEPKTNRQLSSGHPGRLVSQHSDFLA